MPYGGIDPSTTPAKSGSSGSAFLDPAQESPCVRVRRRFVDLAEAAEGIGVAALPVEAPRQMRLEPRLERVQPDSSAELCLGNLEGLAGQEMKGQSVAVVAEVSARPERFFPPLSPVLLSSFSWHPGSSPLRGARVGCIHPLSNAGQRLQ